MDKGKGAIEEPAAHAPDGMHASVHVVKEPVVVDISRRSILGQILIKTGATIRTEGTVRTDNNKKLAWLNIEVPSKEGSMGLPELETFQGMACMTDYEAQESVSEIAICYFITQMNICVNDVSYPAFRESFRQLHHYMSWSELVQSRYETVRMQNDSLFNAHKSLLDRLSSICASYGDVLSLAPCVPKIDPVSLLAKPVMRHGADPRYEQLVQELFNILQEYTPNENPERNPITKGF